MNVSVSEAVAAVSDFLDEEYQTVNQYARQLINAGMLPKSRGRAIASVNVAQLMRLVLAAALRPKYAVRRVGPLRRPCAAPGCIRRYPAGVPMIGRRESGGRVDSPPSMVEGR